VAKLNAAFDKHLEPAVKLVEKLLRNRETVPAKIRATIRNRGGGHFNHGLFWRMLAPETRGRLARALATAIEEGFDRTGFAREGTNRVWG